MGVKGLLEAKRYPESEWENCPNCDNRGGYPVGEDNPIYGEGEDGYPILVGYGSDIHEEQCEFCWTYPKSVYYQIHKLWEKEAQ